MLIFQKIKTVKKDHYNVEQAARLILQTEGDSDVETARDPNYFASEEDGESDDVETDDKCFDDSVDTTTNTTVHITVNITANTRFSIDVGLETRNGDIS